MDEQNQPAEPITPVPPIEPTIEPVPVLPPQKSKRGLLITVVVVLVILFGGAGISYAKYGTLLPPALSNFVTGLVSSDDVAVYDKMLAKIGSIKSADYDISLKFAAEAYSDKTNLPPMSVTSKLGFYSDPFAEIPQDTNFNVNIHGNSSYDKETKNLEGTWNIKGDANVGGIMTAAEFDVVTKDGDVYIRTTKFPELVANIGSLKSKWVKIDKSSMESLVADSYDLQELQAIMSGAYLASVLGQNDTKLFIKLEEIIKEEKPIRPTVITDSATSVSGATHLRFAINQNAVVRVAERFVESLKSDLSYGEYYETESKEAIKYLKGSEAKEIIDYLNKIFVNDLWITRSTSFTKKSSISLTLAFPDMQNPIPKKQVYLGVSVNFNSINDAVKTGVPTEFISAEEAMKIIYETSQGDTSSSLGAAQARGREAGVKANSTTVRIQAEIYYDEHRGYGPITNSCLTGIFSDKTITAAIKREEELTGNKATCAATPTSFAISIPVSSASISRWCVDSSGNVGDFTAKMVNGNASCK